MGPAMAQQADFFAKRMNVGPLWEAGLDGAGCRVAVVDSGINPNEVLGNPPVWNEDYTGEDITDDRTGHGTKVATCIRRIAAQCELMNARATPTPPAPATKEAAARAVRGAAAAGADIVNVSLDFEPRGCDPSARRYFDTSVHPQMVFERWAPDPTRACVLCMACWDVAEMGIAVVVAAGNQWGKPSGCPGRSPGVLVVEASALKSEWDQVWNRKSRLVRWWEWKVRGNVARDWGTSFSAGYASAVVALLMPYVKDLGWMAAKPQFEAAGADGRVTVDATVVLERLRNLVEGPEEDDE
jgi:hypothetical protein